MATAFGPEGMTIIHMLSTISPTTPIFNLDTGYQFPETLALRDRIQQRYGIEVELKRPALSVAEYEALKWRPRYKTEPNRCCGDRKIAVLNKQPEGCMHGQAPSAATKVRSSHRTHCWLGQEISIGES